MKTNFKAFLQEAERHTQMDIATAAKYVYEHCYEAFQSTPIYRGSKNALEYFLVDPTTSERKSLKLEDNFYNYVISNSEPWKDFPRRDRSLICTTDVHDTEDYGNPFRVFAEDGTTWAESPNVDIWFSFRNSPLLRKFECRDLEMLNRKLSWYFNYLKFSQIVQFPFTEYSRTYNEMLVTFEAVENGLKEISIDEISKDIDDNKTIPSNMRNSFIEMSVQFKKTSIFETLSEMLDPTLNDFELVETNKIKPAHKREVWTDAKCIMVRENQYEDFAIEIFKLVKEAF